MVWWKTLKKEARSLVAQGTWYGSRCVPKTSVIRAGIRTVEEQLSVLSHRKTLLDHIAYHNLFTIYVYQIVQFTTAVRPLVTPPFTAETVDVNTGLVLIADKDSQFSEERLGLLSPIAKVAVHDLTTLASPTLLKRLGVTSYVDVDVLRRLQDPLFYLVDPETKAISSLSPTRIARILALYTRLKDRWRFPPNVHRHFVRSWLFNRARLPFEVINYLMGHKHFLHEPFHAYGSTHMGEIHAVLAEELDRLLLAIGVTPVRFQP